MIIVRLPSRVCRRRFMCRPGPFVESVVGSGDGSRADTDHSLPDKLSRRWRRRRYLRHTRREHTCGVQ